MLLLYEAQRFTIDYAWSAARQNQRRSPWRSAIR